MLNIKRFLPVALVLGVIGWSSTACASYGYGNNGRYGGYDRGRYIDSRYVERQAYDRGFRDGLRAGERDGRGGRRYDPSRHGDWRDADDGFRREYGDHNLYRRAFRGGFESGYSQGYRQYDGRYRRY
jgi:hypothetical protein